MKVFYKGRTNRTEAFGEYDKATGKLRVLKGSIVSENVAQFKRTEEIKKLRTQYIDNNGVLLQDKEFSSASTAAAFVVGYSADGLIAWHVEKHLTLKRFLSRNKDK